MSTRPSRRALRGAGTVLALAALLTAGLVSCSTLPLPASPDESLVVFTGSVKYFVVREMSVTGAVLSIESLDRAGAKSATAILNDEFGYAAVSLVPGTYRVRLSGISCKNARGGTWTDRHDRNLGSLYVEPNSVILFRNHVSVSAGNWYNYRLNGWLMDSEIERILEMLRADARWPAWDAYSLVNFLR